MCATTRGHASGRSLGHAPLAVSQLRVDRVSGLKTPLRGFTAALCPRVDRKRKSCGDQRNQKQALAQHPTRISIKIFNSPGDFCLRALCVSVFSLQHAPSRGTRPQKSPFFTHFTQVPQRFFEASLMRPTPPQDAQIKRVFRQFFADLQRKRGPICLPWPGL